MCNLWVVLFVCTWRSSGRKYAIGAKPVRIRTQGSTLRKSALAACKTLGIPAKQVVLRLAQIAPHRAQIYIFHGGMGARQSVSADDAPETCRQDAFPFPAKCTHRGASASADSIIFLTDCVFTQWDQGCIENSGCAFVLRGGTWHTHADAVGYDKIGPRCAITPYCA